MPTFADLRYLLQRYAKGGERMAGKTSKVAPKKPKGKISRGVRKR